MHERKKKNNEKPFFSGRAKEVGIISAILIIVISFGLFFYQQNITEDNVRNSLFVQHRDRQMETTEGMSQRIGSDLRSVLSILEGLTSSTYLQQGVLQGDRVDKLVRERFDEISEITRVDRLLIIDENDTVKYDLFGEGQRSFANMDFSTRDFVQETRNTSSPVVSDGFQGMDGIYRIAITAPIINQESGQYIGMIAVQIPTEDFFARYGNVYDIESQYLAVLDRKSVQLIHPVKSLVGTPFFGNHTQEATGHNKILNNLIQTVMSGRPDSAIYEFRNAQRLTTGYPIPLHGRPEFFNFVINPTTEIYTQVNDVLFTERLKMSSLVVGAAAAIVVLIVFLIRWNSMLNNQIKRRTRELEESNKQLESHDKLQKEFIDTAAHELRTPIQPILGLSEILSAKMKDQKQREILDVIARNAKRLQRLAEDILDVSRFESQSLPLNKERFNINDVIQSVVREYQNQLESNSGVNISFEPREDVMLVDADETRLRQVISNLLDNSLKFTRSGGGKISIVSEKKEDRVIVTVKDTGMGIDPEIMPKLFSRFASKSFSGTGLGLYLSKKIIESHGGSISGQNNSDGVGATFSFSLLSAW